MRASIKIFSKEKLLSEAKLLRDQGRKIILCDGHFNIIHPGHMRFLNFCRDQGDFLVVAIFNRDQLDQASRDHYFDQIERARGVSALEMVTAVYLLNEPVDELISEIQPDQYIKGREFEDMPEKISAETAAVKQYGGKVIFASGDIDYTTNQLVQRVPLKTNKRFNSFISTCAKYGIKIEDLKSSLNKMTKTNLLVLGDTIVDQFVACDTLGVSAEAPVLAIRELDAKEYLGGAAIVANHSHALGGDCYFVSVTGEDQTAKLVEDRLTEAKIQHHLIADPSRPTSFKIRYMVDDQKLLRVSRLRQHQISKKIENEIIFKIKEILPHVNGILISDFVYGLITPRLLKAVTKMAADYGMPIFGDLQCSSQLGDVSKFKRFTTIAPTEKEARIALMDQSSGLEKIARELLKKTSCEHVIVTLGSQGLLVYSQSGLFKTDHAEHFCALESKPVDVAGAGDAFFSTFSVAMSSGLNVIAASALGSCASAITVGRMGNLPVGASEIRNYLDEMINYGIDSRIDIIKPHEREETHIGVYN